MNKMPIDWHIQCLENSKNMAEFKRRQLLQLQEDVDRMDKNNQFYTLQIETALKEGKKAFDSDRYLVKRKTK